MYVQTRPSACFSNSFSENSDFIQWKFILRSRFIPGKRFIWVTRRFPFQLTYVQGTVSCKNNFVRLKYSRYHRQYEIVIPPKIVQWPREYVLRTEAISYLLKKNGDLFVCGKSIVEIPTFRNERWIFPWSRDEWDVFDTLAVTFARNEVLN